MDRANISADPQRLASALSYLQQQGSPMMQEGMPQGQHMMPDGQPMPDQMMPPQQMMPDQMMPPLQAADMGRGGDTTVGHLTPGEVVVPVDLQTPQLMAALMEALGPDFGRYQVGGDDDSINPQTGMPEFGYDDGGYGSESNPGGGVSGANTGGFGSAGGDYGPSEGASWGPSNPDAQGNSQYGSNVFGMTPTGVGMDYGSEFGTTPYERSVYGNDYGFPGSRHMGGGSFSYNPSTREMAYNSGFGAPKESFGGMNFMGFGIGERTNPFTNQTQYTGTFNPGSLVGGLLGGAINPIGGMAAGYLGGKMTDTRFGNFAPPSPFLENDKNG